MSQIESTIEKLGIKLPVKAPTPLGSFRPVYQTQQLLYVSGQGPILEDGTIKTGKVGLDVSAEEAQDHARIVALNLIAHVREHLGDLDQVKGVVKLLGMVNAVPEFTQQPFVIDGASNLLADVFGTKGIHARSAVGVSSLPLGISVEIEAIFEVYD